MREIFTPDTLAESQRKKGTKWKKTASTIMPRACANERHGCGWRDADGKLHETYPFFAVRKMMRELYEFVEARGGRIDAHQSGYVCPATLAFAHSYWDGEQLAVSSQNIKQSLNLDAFRAEYSHPLAMQ